MKSFVYSLPLALLALATPALQAGVINNLSCSVLVGTGTCSLAAVSSSNPNLPGLSMSTDGQGVIAGSGPNASTRTELLAIADVNATMSGVTLPVLWDFSGFNVEVSDPLDWTLTVSAVFAPAPGPAQDVIGFIPQVIYTTSGTGSIDGTLISGNALTNAISGQITQLQIDLTTSNANGYGYTLSVPAGASVDVNASAAATPEPGSVVLSLSGLAGLAAAFRRKRA